MKADPTSLVELDLAIQPKWRRTKFIGVRLVAAMVSIWGAATIVFFLTRLTGDPVSLMSPPGADPAQLDATAKFFGLDRPLIIQYFDYLKDLATFSFGESYYQRQPAGAVVANAVGPTLMLAGISFLVTLAVAIPAAMLATRKAGKRTDKLLTSSASVGISVPDFWLGPLLILLFAGTLRWVDGTQMTGPSSFILPVITQSTTQISILFVLARAALVKQRNESYVYTARAKGASERRILLRHVMPNGSLEILTVMGLILANLIASNIVVEMVFAWPGLGQLLVTSMSNYDFPIIQLLTLIYASAFVVILLVVDALYRLIDPRA
ncbi:ABC transporter permease [Cumulibacter soli]|uniref:ABC transporter permease n=1 Tax=Cumulibacter soli TaxID=2546344 RepID=UPI00141A01F1|nr:ABC transporter permease [Cumulibacter soli]